MSPRRERRAKEGTAPPPASGRVVAEADATHEEIARRAYQLFLERGGENGQDVNDWLRAEAELRTEKGLRQPGLKP
jgi:hypothetical protein